MRHIDKSISTQELMDQTTIFMPLGGQGSRAREYTEGKYSKFLIPLKPDFTVLDGILISLLDAGFRNYVFCIGTLFPEEIVERVLSHKEKFDKLGCTYKFSYEKKLLGGVGAYAKAIKSYNISGPVISVPGDMFLPWHSFPELVRFHIHNQCSVSIGLTDFITNHTSDVGKIWVNQKSSDITKCLARTEDEKQKAHDVLQLTSAGVYAFNPIDLLAMYREVQKNDPTLKSTQIEMRDQILPWMISDERYVVKGYNFSQEILDVGTYDRILYATKHWRKYFKASLIPEQ